MNSFRTLFAFLILTTLTIFAQNEIPNPSFENWTGGNPNSWYSTNTVQTNNITQHNVAHEGSSSLRGEIIEFFTVPYFPSIAANNGTIAQPFPITKNYESLNGYFQYYPSQPGLNIWFTVTVDLSNENGAVAHGDKQITNLETNSWTQFDVDLIYLNNNNGDATRAAIQITLGGDFDGEPAELFGTYFLVDNLSFDGVTSVEQRDENVPHNYELGQNFPNPFNPTTQINFSIPVQNNVEISIYNILGEKVATLLNENLQAGNYSTNWNAENVSSGNYIYRIISDNYVQSKMMTLLK